MAAPSWRIQIAKSLGSDHWSNDYLTDDATIEDAQDLSALLLTFEQQIHQTGVNFDYIRISSFAPGDRIFRHLTINQPGVATSGVYLPLYNTVRMDMGTSNSDPARKYYRVPVNESIQTNGVLDSAYQTAFAGAISTYLITPTVLEHIVTNAGHTVENATLSPFVQMRQLHRRRKKKVVAP